MKVWWLSHMLAHHPYIILISVFIISSTCLIVPLTTKKFPNFSDPQLGFEARGTVLSQRLTSWQNLMEATKVHGNLIDNPLEYQYYLQQMNNQDQQDSQNSTQTAERKTNYSKKKHKNYEKGERRKSNKLKNNAVKELNMNHSTDKWDNFLKLKHERVEEYTDKKNFNHVNSNNFFCNELNSDYSRVVVGSVQDNENLWSVDGVLAQCRIDALIRSSIEFSSLCQTEEDDERVTKQKCCRTWSPANYVALLSNRKSCLGVTESDLNRIETLLQNCAYYYQNFQLTRNCAEDVKCKRQVPAECYTYNAPYHLLHYLLDQDFIRVNKEDKSTNRTNVTLHSVMMFLPIAASSATLELYKTLNVEGLSYGKFEVVAMEFGLKNTLFDRLLLSDSFLLLFGFIFIMLSVWIYTGSLLLTISSVIAVIFSLGISYAIYTLVLRINFFPFMNLLAIVVVVGIGTDDAFIFCKLWELNKRRKPANAELIELMQETMRHALPSMFVTSLTTAVAFFSSIVSNVTAINCFSLFSGMSVIANFFLMVTWLPASVVISEYCQPSVLSPANFVIRKFVRPLRIFNDKVTNAFSQHLKFVIINYRWICLFGLSGIAVAACTIVFRYPGLQLPDSPDFQLFDSSHVFEKYDLIYTKRFWFEKLEMIDGGAMLPLRFVWGVKARDNGDYLDPTIRGTWEPDESFDITSPESQIWLQQFCRNLRAQPFYRSTLGPLLPNCFIETLYSWMQRRCEGPLDSEIDRTPCCESSTFPYTPDILQQCAAEMSAEIYRTPLYLWNPRGVLMGGLKFLKEPLQHTTLTSNTLISNNNNSSNGSSVSFVPTIKAVIVEYDSTRFYSLSYADMDSFFNEVESWMQEQLRSAPPGMRGGWFVSRLEFYELQRTLYGGTLWAIVVSMSLALVVLIFVTLNLLVSLYTIITICAIIVVTIASLVLFGWRLNVLESVAVSTAIGLAVDFSLHYAINYRACNTENPVDRVKTALEQMGGPTLMASVTTGAAGAFMLPSHVLAYIQIGIFLLFVMGISWLYATLFLCPLLAVAGPSPSFAQFRYPRVRKSLFTFRQDMSTCGDNGIEMNSDNVVSTGNCRRKNGKGRKIFSNVESILVESNSTFNTSHTASQIHCKGELEILPTPSLPVSSTMPSSPSSSLLDFEVNYSNTVRCDDG